MEHSPQLRDFSREKSDERGWEVTAREGPGGQHSTLLTSQVTSGLPLPPFWAEERAKVCSAEEVGGKC